MGRTPRNTATYWPNGGIHWPTGPRLFPDAPIWQMRLRGQAAMSHLPSTVPSDEELLGILAFQFRGTRDSGVRNEIAKSYAEAVDRLIRTGHWDEAPSLEDILPDDCMPPSFYRYWCDE